MPVVAAGQKRTGTLRTVASSEDISLGALYEVQGYFHPISNLSDSLIQRGVNALVGLDSPIDVTWVEVLADGHVTIQGRAAHNSPVAIIAAALILVLAGIGIALTVSHVYTVTDAVISGGGLPGGAPGDSGGGGGILAPIYDLVPLLLIAAGVFIWFRYFRS